MLVLVALAKKATDFYWLNIDKDEQKSG